jgi:hypothetical protein
MGSAKVMCLLSGSVIMTVLTLSPDVRSLALMLSFSSRAIRSSALVTISVKEPEAASSCKDRHGDRNE